MSSGVLLRDDHQDNMFASDAAAAGVFVRFEDVLRLSEEVRQAVLTVGADAATADDGLGGESGLSAFDAAGAADAVFSLSGGDVAGAGRGGGFGRYFFSGCFDCFFGGAIGGGRFNGGGGTSGGGGGVIGRGFCGGGAGTGGRGRGARVGCGGCGLGIASCGCGGVV